MPPKKGGSEHDGNERRGCELKRSQCKTLDRSPNAIDGEPEGLTDSDQSDEWFSRLLIQAIASVNSPGKSVRLVSVVYIRLLERWVFYITLRDQIVKLLSVKGKCGPVRCLKQKATHIGVERVSHRPVCIATGMELL